MPKRATLLILFLAMNLAFMPCPGFAKIKVNDAQAIQLSNQALSTKGQSWTLNGNEETNDAGTNIWNRVCTGPVNAKTWAVLNNSQNDVAAIVLHYQSDQPIEAFTWQVRQILIDAGPTNQDTFFVGYATDAVAPHGKGPINPALFTPIEKLTFKGSIKKTLERPSFQINNINTKNIYIYIGRQDINHKGDTKNIYFNITSSFSKADSHQSFFRIDPAINKNAAK